MFAWLKRLFGLGEPAQAEPHVAQEPQEAGLEEDSGIGYDPFREEIDYELPKAYTIPPTSAKELGLDKLTKEDVGITPEKLAKDVADSQSTEAEEDGADGDAAADAASDDAAETVLDDASDGAAESPAESPAQAAPQPDAAGTDTPAAEQAAAPIPTYAFGVGDGVFVRRRTFVIVHAIGEHGVEVRHLDDADGSGGTLTYPHDQVSELFRPAVSPAVAQACLARLAPPIEPGGAPDPSARAALEAHLGVVVREGVPEAVADVLRELYSLPANTFPSSRVEIVEGAILRELAHVLGRKPGELRAEVRAHAPMFAVDESSDDPPSASSDDSPSEAPTVSPNQAAEAAPSGGPDGLPTGWSWLGSLDAAKGVVIGERFGSADDKTKKSGAVCSLRPVSAGGTWHALQSAEAAEIAIVHADHMGALADLRDARKKLGKLMVAKGPVCVVSKAERDDAAVVDALGGDGATDLGLRLPTGGDSPVEVQVSRDGRKAVLLTLPTA